MDPLFFESAAHLRTWFQEHHTELDEVFIGFYKKSSGRTGATYPEAVDEALCVGWIDGVRHTRDAETYTNRFTPRRKGSKWSDVNIRRVEQLIAEGRMLPAGLAAFEQRHNGRDIAYSHESPHAQLSGEEQARFQANGTAWAFWESQPPGYRRIALHWATTAKRPETRARRLATLIDDSARGQRIALLRRNTAS